MSCREHHERVTLGSRTLVLALSPCMPPTEFPSLKYIHDIALRVRAFWPGRERAFWLLQLLSLRGQASLGNKDRLKKSFCSGICFSNVGNIVFEFPPLFKVLRISREVRLNQYLQTSETIRDTNGPSFSVKLFSLAVIQKGLEMLGRLVMLSVSSLFACPAEEPPGK